MPRKLKVFRTPTGFHDAYVAAPSRKAALEAWGSDADLFARGVAEEVSDPKLMAEPLEHPGEVIRVSRGDLKAQLKALGPRHRATGKRMEETKPASSRKPGKPKPLPKRDKVDRAEAALEAASKAQANEQAVLETQIQALEARLDGLRKRQAKKLAELEARREKAQADYRDALDAWGD